MLFSCFGILREMMSPHWYGSAGKNGGGHYLMRFKIHCHRVAYLIVQKTLGEEGGGGGGGGQLFACM